MKISHGVPHITVLCSLLFLLYINDLPFNIHGANCFVFADDINVLITDIAGPSGRAVLGLGLRPLAC